MTDRDPDQAPPALGPVTAWDDLTLEHLSTVHNWAGLRNLIQPGLAKIDPPAWMARTGDALPKDALLNHQSKWTTATTFDRLMASLQRYVRSRGPTTAARTAPTQTPGQAACAAGQDPQQADTPGPGTARDQDQPPIRPDPPLGLPLDPKMQAWVTEVVQACVQTQLQPIVQLAIDRALQDFTGQLKASLAASVEAATSAKVADVSATFHAQLALKQEELEKHYTLLQQQADTIKGLKVELRNLANHLKQTGEREQQLTALVEEAKKAAAKASKGASKGNSSVRDAADAAVAETLTAQYQELRDAVHANQLQLQELAAVVAALPGGSSGQLAAGGKGQKAVTASIQNLEQLQQKLAQRVDLIDRAGLTAAWDKETNQRHTHKWTLKFHKLLEVMAGRQRPHHYPATQLQQTIRRFLLDTLKLQPRVVEDLLAGAGVELLVPPGGLQVGRCPPIALNCKTKSHMATILEHSRKWWQGLAEGERATAPRVSRKLTPAQSRFMADHIWPLYEPALKAWREGTGPACHVDYIKMVLWVGGTAQNKGDREQALERRLPPGRSWDPEQPAAATSA